MTDLTGGLDFSGIPKKEDPSVDGELGAEQPALDFTGIPKDEDYALEDNLKQAVKKNPEQAVKERKLSETSGYQPEVVERNYQDIEQGEKVKKAKALAGESKALTKVLSDPVHAKELHDDVDNLIVLEKVIQEEDGFLADFGKRTANIMYSLAQSVGGQIEFAGDITEINRAEIMDALTKVNFDLSPPKQEGGELAQDFVGQMISSAGKLNAEQRLFDALYNQQLSPEVAKMVQNKEYMSAYAALKNKTYDTEAFAGAKKVEEFVATHGKSIADFWAGQRHEVVVEPESIQWYMGSAYEGIGTTLVPGVLAGIATRGTSIPGSVTSGLVMWEATFGRTYNENKKTMGYSDAAAASVFQTATEVISEGIPLGILTKEGGKFVMRTVKASGAEGVQEMINEAMNIAYEYGVLAKDTPPGEILTRLKHAGIIGVIGGTQAAIITAPFQGSAPSKAAGPGSNFSKDAEKAQGAYDQAGSMNKVVEKVEEIKAKKDSPEAVKTFIEEVVGSESEVIIPAEDADTFFQEHPEVLENLPEEVHESIQEAVSRKGDVSIPKADYLTYLSEHHEQLADSLRNDMDGMNVREAKEWAEQGTEEVQAEMDKILVEMEKETEFVESGARVESQLKQALVEAGVAESVAGYNAKLHALFAMSMSKKEGVNMTPEEVFKDNMLRVQSSQIEGPTLSQEEVASNMGITVEELSQDDYEKAVQKDSEAKAHRVRQLLPNVAGTRQADGATPWDTATSVKGESGVPTRTYRGTRGDLLSPRSFQPDRLGGSTGHGSAGWGVWASEDPDYAIDYGKVEEFYLDIRNPKVYTVDSQPEPATVAEGYAHQQELIAQGYDGIRLDNSSIGKPDQWVAFKPEQFIHVEKEEGPLFQGAIEQAQRNEIGLYSAVEQGIIDMKLPVWKGKEKVSQGFRVHRIDNGKPALPEIFATREEADQALKKEGVFEVLEVFGTKPASNKEIWGKIDNLPGIKTEEKEALGLEEFLQSRGPKGKFTREEVLAFVRTNGVQVEETIGDQEEGEGEVEGEFDWDETIDDDSSNWEGRAEDYMYEYNHADSFGEADGYFWNWSKWLHDNIDQLKSNIEGSLNDPELEAELADADTGAEVQDIYDRAGYDYWEDVKQMAEDDYREAAESAAEEEYMDNPYVQYDDSETGFTIYGNDDVGYRGEDRNGREIFTEVWSFDEAAIQAEQDVRDDGLWGEPDEDDESIARWSGYVMEGPHDNYREVKLKIDTSSRPGKMPLVAEALHELVGDFYETAHFPDANIVAFMRVTDRDLHATPNEPEDIDAVLLKIPNMLKVEEVDFESDNLPGNYWNSGRRITVDEMKATGLEEGGREYMAKLDWAARQWKDMDYHQRRDEIDKNIRIRKEYEREKAIDEYDGGDGGKVEVYFIDEFQSDWHSEGRKAGGYKTGQDAGELEQRARDILSDLEEITIDRMWDLMQEDTEYFEPITGGFGVEPLVMAVKIDTAGPRFGATESFNVNKNDLNQTMLEMTRELRPEHIKAKLIEPTVPEGQDPTDYKSYWEVRHKKTNAIVRRVPGKYTEEEAMSQAVTPLHERSEAYQASRNIVEEFMEKAGIKMSDIITTVEQYDAEMKVVQAERHGPPDVPFKGDAWHALGLKRAILQAVEQGKDAFAWPNSQVFSNSRWSDHYDYSAQYDRKMPSLAKKLMKKLGFKVQPQQLTKEGFPVKVTKKVVREFTDRAEAEGAIADDDSGLLSLNVVEESGMWEFGTQEEQEAALGKLKKSIKAFREFKSKLANKYYKKADKALKDKKIELADAGNTYALRVVHSNAMMDKYGPEGRIESMNEKEAAAHKRLNDAVTEKDQESYTLAIQEFIQQKNDAVAMKKASVRALDEGPLLKSEETMDTMPDMSKEEMRKLQTLLRKAGVAKDNMKDVVPGWGRDAGVQGQYQIIETKPDQGYWIVPLTQEMKDKITADSFTLFQEAQNKPAFYSAALHSAINLKQAKGSPTQMLAMLKKGGAKQEEIDWMGLEEWINDQGKSVTKDQIAEFIRDNRVKLEEKFLEEGDAAQDQFKEYQLPGGEKAKTLLLSLPAKDPLVFSGEIIYDNEDMADDILTDIAMRGFEGLDYGRDESSNVIAFDGLTEDQFNQFKQIANINRALDVTFKSEGDASKKTFSSGHFGEVHNLLAHVRFNERIDADGKRVLFIEEVQSDWHQQGREHGYKPDTTGYKAEEFQPGRWDIYDSKGKLINTRGPVAADSEAEAMQLITSMYLGYVPDAPFKKSWPILAMKRMIRYAADNGFDRVAWTTGEQQNERYDLSKKVSKVTAEPDGTDTYVLRAYDLDGFKVANQHNLTKEQLVDYIGKPAVEKLFKEENVQQNIEGGPIWHELSGQDLRLGGEGMLGFYDDMLPRMVNKYVKKWGGKVDTTQVPTQEIEKEFVDEESFMEITEDHARQLLTDGYEVSGFHTEAGAGDTIHPVSQNPYAIEEMSEYDHFWLESDQVQNAGLDRTLGKKIGAEVHSLDITPEMHESALMGAAMFQGEQGPRGQISFTPDESVISLLEGADLSTFLHESGHFFFESMKKMSEKSPEVAKDMQKLLDFIGIKNLEEWNSMGLEQRREGHEKVARAFEAYLFEGKAPSLEMESLFQTFRSWLVDLYKSIKNLNVELTDEVRGVFDRMLATEEQIRAKKVASAYTPLFAEQEGSGLTDKKWKEYQKIEARRHAEGQGDLERKSLKDMKWLANAKSKVLKKLQKDAKDKRKAMKEEVELDVANEPVYIAMKFLKTGEAYNADGELIEFEDHKIDLDEFKEAYPNMIAPRGMTKKDGIPMDVAAEQMGFSSGDEMMKAILEAEKQKDRVERITDQRMLETYGDINNPEAMDRAAEEAIHNKAHTKFLHTELSALVKMTGAVNVLARAAKAYANQAIARKKIRDIRPGQYSSAETRAAKAAEKALMKGDRESAAEHKRAQVLNNHFFRSANKARTDIEKIVKYLKKFNNKGTRKNLDVEYLDQIDALLERFDLRKGTSLKAIDARKSLAEWAAAQEEMGLEPIIDEALLAEANKKHYKDMTVEELRGLNDAIKNIEHLGRLKKKLLTAKDEREFQEIVAAAEASIVSHAKKTRKTELESNSWLQKAVKGKREWMMSHRKLASILRVMDGGKDGGILWDIFLRPMNEAGDRETVATEKATMELDEIFKPLLKLGRMTKKEFIPAINASLSREGRISVALNMGNETNKQRLMAGDGWNEAQLQAILDTLTKEEMDAVQEVWDFIDSFWPEIAAKEKRVTGVTPKKVERMPVETKHGEYSGGYYPIKYDPERSTRAESDELAEQAKDAMKGMYSRRTTARGHTKERVAKVKERPVRKDFGVIFEHIDQVIHDLSWHEWLIDANRLMQNKNIDKAIRKHYGAEALRMIKDAIDTTAAGDDHARTVFSKSINWLRTGTSIAGMGWNLWTSFLQPMGLSQSMVRIGPKWVGRGIAQWFKGAVHMEKTVANIYEKSDFMRLRGKTQMREINEIRNRVSKGKTLPAVQDSFFYLIAKAQMMADVPTWLGAYEKAVHEGNLEERAVQLANQAVLDAQGGGQIKDLAQIQKGGPLMKLWTNFYSYFNTTFNLTAESWDRMDIKKPKDVGRFAVDLMLLYTVPATISALMRELLKGDCDGDTDCIIENVVRENLSYMSGTMVGTREMSSFVQGYYGYSGPAGTRFFGEISKLAAQVEQGEMDEAAWRALNNTSGILFHYPAGQVDRMARGFIAIKEGEVEGVEAVAAPLFGPPR